MLTLKYRDYETLEFITIDSVLTHNGLFEFNGPIQGFLEVFIFDEKNSKTSNSILIEPSVNDIIKINCKEINCDYCDFCFKNTSTNIEDRVHKLNKSLVNLYNNNFVAYSHWDSISTISDFSTNNNPVLSMLRDSISRIIDSISNVRVSLQDQFIKNNYNSPYSAFYLYHPVYYNGNFENILKHYEKLDIKVRKSFYGVMLKEKLNKYFIIGQKASDIRGFDFKNRSVSLDSLKGKFVVLDFWASWCIPCRNHNTELYDYLQTKPQYSDISVVCISEDNKEDDWIQAIKKDGIDGWYHLIKKEVHSDLSQYYFNTIPMKYLISPAGVIVYQSQNYPDFIDAINREISE